MAKLAKREARSQTGLFLLEGPQAVREALTFRPQLVVDVFATPSALERHGDIARAAVEAEVEAEVAVGCAVAVEVVSRASAGVATNASDIARVARRALRIAVSVRISGRRGRASSRGGGCRGTGCSRR